MSQILEVIDKIPMGKQLSLGMSSRKTLAQGIPSLAAAMTLISHTHRHILKVMSFPIIGKTALISLILFLQLDFSAN